MLISVLKTHITTRNRYRATSSIVGPITNHYISSAAQIDSSVVPANLLLHIYIYSSIYICMLIQHSVADEP